MATPYSGKYIGQGYLGNKPFGHSFHLFINEDCSGGTFTIESESFKLDHFQCGDELFFDVTIDPPIGGYGGTVAFKGRMVAFAPKIIWGSIKSDMADDPTWTAQATPGQ